MIGIGLIGCGMWGPNYIRIFNDFPDVSVIQCCDLETDRLSALKLRYNNIEIVREYCNVLDNLDIDAVVIATPASTHYQIAKDSLSAGKDVLVEKPLALVPEEVIELVDVAQKMNRILMVGHVFIYNDCIVKIKEIISNDFGKVRYICSTRTNLGPVRRDASVIWDLAVHDISIFLYLLDAVPLEVSATGRSYLQQAIEDVVFANLSFYNSVTANVRVSWLDPRKVRTLAVIGVDKMLVFDDMDNFEPIRIYNKGIESHKAYSSFGEFQLRFRDGDIVSPKVVAKEPLKNQCVHFLDCIRTRSEPITNGASAFDIVNTLRAIQESIKLRGVPVEVE